jgi:hypothetical protein
MAGLSLNPAALGDLLPRCTESLDACMKVYERMREKGWFMWEANDLGPNGIGYRVMLRHQKKFGDVLHIAETLPLAFAKALLAAGEREKG